MTLNFGGEWNIVITNDVMYQNGWKKFENFQSYWKCQICKKKLNLKKNASQKNFEKCHIINMLKCIFNKIIIIIQNLLYEMLKCI